MQGNSWRMTLLSTLCAANLADPAYDTPFPDSLRKRPLYGIKNGDFPSYGFGGLRETRRVLFGCGGKSGLTSGWGLDILLIVG
jgi:hypothetical protein